MIVSIRHRGLRMFAEKGDGRGLNPEHIERLQHILTMLEYAESLGDLKIHGFRLHQLTGNRKGTWAITVRANWRITFTFDGTHVHDVNYEDYH